MAFQVGDKVRIKASPVAQLEVVETDVDGDPGRLMVQPVKECLGKYPSYCRAEWLIAEADVPVEN